MFKKILVSFFVALTVLMTTGISLVQAQRDIIVSAAISLKDTFEEMGRLYEDRHKGINILFNFASSGALRRQIEGGAPIDVFASASLKDMDNLEQKNLIMKDTRVNIATNRVVLVAPLVSKMGLKSFENLTSKKIRRIAIGNPKTVPAGRYAQEVFAHYKIAEHIKDRLIFGENARQVLDYVARGEVDAGVVYLTDAMIGAKKVRIAATASEASHSPVVYPMAVARGARNEALAREFVSFVSSIEGARIMEKYGFRVAR